MTKTPSPGQLSVHLTKTGHYCLILFLVAALILALKLTFLIPLKVKVVTYLLLMPGNSFRSLYITPTTISMPIAYDKVNQATQVLTQAFRLGEQIQTGASTSILSLNNRSGLIAANRWSFWTTLNGEKGLLLERSQDSNRPDDQGVVLQDEDRDGDLDILVKDYDQAADWLNDRKQLLSYGDYNLRSSLIQTQVFSVPFTVSHADIIYEIAKGTRVPPIALAAGVEIQAPGRWDDVAAVTVKCGVEDCDPSVGIGQVRPSEVEQYTSLKLDRFWVNLALMSSPELSVRMMQAKLAEAQRRFESVCQGRCTETDYFLMYALAHNGLSTETMKIAVNESWEKALQLNDQHFARGDWVEKVKYEFYGEAGDYRWFIRRHVELLEMLQQFGYTLPEGVDVAYIRKLGAPRQD